MDSHASSDAVDNVDQAPADSKEEEPAIGSKLPAGPLQVRITADPTPQSCHHLPPGRGNETVGSSSVPFLQTAGVVLLTCCLLIGAVMAAHHRQWWKALSQASSATSAVCANPRPAYGRWQSLRVAARCRLGMVLAGE